MRHAFNGLATSWPENHRRGAARMIAAGLLEEKAGVLWPTQRAEATFAAKATVFAAAPTPAAPSGPIDQGAL
jgi:hypothetical protein